MKAFISTLKHDRGYVFAFCAYSSLELGRKRTSTIHDPTIELLGYQIQCQAAWSVHKSVQQWIPKSWPVTRDKYDLKNKLTYLSKKDFAQPSWVKSHNSRSESIPHLPTRQEGHRGLRKESQSLPMPAVFSGWASWLTWVAPLPQFEAFSFMPLACKRTKEEDLVQPIHTPTRHHEANPMARQFRNMKVKKQRLESSRSFGMRKSSRKLVVSVLFSNL